MSQAKNYLIKNLPNLLQLHIWQDIVTCATCEGRNYRSNMHKVDNGYICDFCLTDPDEPLNIVITAPLEGNDVEQ
jgi:hypothetical protein